MGLYLGNQKVKIVFDEIYYSFHIGDTEPIYDGTLLLTSDNYILTDKNNYYISAKEDN